ncbi:hypothetical protein FQR65_LT20319 [Abscondita terminalis]|nr:hypothetical protein FQR65_LT20319 [Abscondita terminalis]
MAWLSGAGLRKRVRHEADAHGETLPLRSSAACRTKEKRSRLRCAGGACSHFTGSLALAGHVSRQGVPATAMAPDVVVSPSRSQLGGFGFGDGTALGVVHGFLGLACLVVGQARAGRDQAAHDDVFLQATQLVALAHDGSLGEHAGRFLERCGRDEGVGRQRGLGDAQQHVGVRRGQLAVALQGLVGVEDLRALDLLAGDVGRIAGVLDHDAAQHLANDHLDVLVVDLHALQAVDVLHFVDDVARQLLDAQQAQDVCDGGASTMTRPLLTTWLRGRRCSFLGHGSPRACGAGHLAAVPVLGVRASKLTRATAGNVGGSLPSTGIRASTSPGPTSWPSRTWISAPTWKPMVTEWSVPGILTSWLLASTSLTWGRTTLAEPRRLGSITTSVDRPVTSSTCLATVRPSSTFSNFTWPAYSTGLDVLVGLDRQHGAVRHLVALALAAVVADDDFARARDHDQLTLGVADVAHRAVEADGTIGLGFHAGRDGGARCGTTDVEGTHGQLRAGFADGLGGDHTTVREG